ncbi:pyridoxal phosphate enzyme (YggS family) [Arcanobacterium pluranimalium]|uniref:YggS family pyridoxal phosphate-dependent enzyme n=1 Tax=Arcanobacterium pluranimalium TaxID=108028 RepID=UPI001956B0A1|nr:YggS family pyridoxal phosphate-dependent enzyme [Arcanobacterium pluranimalium]MBM7825732.1 pyridoxal phosphate enzyme (YggS family) [Arcanobacterium pluranimalium]
MSKIDIEGNIRAVRDRIREAALAAGREPGEIKLMLAAKYQPVENLIRAMHCGETLLGHNLVHQLQDSERELQTLEAPSHTTTVIGHVQSNKLSLAMTYAQRIDTVDSLKYAQRINRRQEARCAAGEATQPYPVLLQVNSSAAPTQFGCEPNALLDLARSVAALPYVTVQGLMTIGANSTDPDAVATSFATTRSLLIAMNEIEGLENARELSMGMTSDLELAIAHGSTLVRVGTAIFGARNV